MDEISEDEIEDNLRKHYEYIRRNLNWTDLVIYYDLFSPGEKGDIRTKGKSDPIETTKFALDIILKSNKPRKFNALAKAMREAGFPKLVDILMGNGVPTNEYHRVIIGDCERYIRDNLDPRDVLNQLVRENVLSNNDADFISSLARNRGNGEATFELMTCLPKRHRDWYNIFVQVLTKTHYDDLVNKIKERANNILSETLKGVGDRVDQSVVDRQTSSSSMSSTDSTRLENESTDFKIIVSDCNKMNCQRKDFYCQKHKTRFCHNCSFNQHRECVLYDLTYYTATTESGLENMANLQTYLQACLSWRKEYRKEIENQAEKFTNEIRDDHANLVKQLEELKMSRTFDINELKLYICATLDKDINQLNEELRNLVYHNQLALERRPIVNFDSVIADIELSFVTEQIKTDITCLENTGYPGTITIQGPRLRELFKQFSERRFSVKENKTHIRTFIVAKKMGCCLLPNNNVVLCDREEMKLRVHQKIMFKYNIDMQSKPWDIGLVSDTEAVVSLPENNIIQFLSISERPELGKKLTTPKPCWYLFCTEDEIYGCCGSAGSQGEVQIFSLDGSLKKCLRNEILNTKIEGMRIFVKDLYIYAVFAESNLLHITNTKNMNTTSFEHKRLFGPSSVFVNSDNTILIGDVQRNRLQEFRIVNEVLVLLQNYDLDLKPQHILEKKADRSLLVVGTSAGI